MSGTKAMQRLCGLMRKAVQQYEMLSPGDRVLVGVSGGKDSVALTVGLAQLRQYLGFPFEVTAVTLDPQFGGQPVDYSALEALFRQYGVPYEVRRTLIGPIVFDYRKEKNPCSLCANLRRGALHAAAEELDCNKVALGHHLDDAIETRNHFTAFNYVIDHADDPVDAGYVCRLHALLKRGTSQDGDPGFNVGGYKTRDNAIVQRMGVAMVRTVPAGDVPGMMERVYAAYAGLSDDPVRIAMCHWMFERVHPFSDGNGRVGRLVMFKECLRLDTVPPLVRDENRNMYVRGLDEFPGQPGWLVDTLLAERDSYLSSFIETLAPGAVRCSYADEWSEGASSGVLAEAADFERDVESLAASGDGPDGDEDPFASYYGGARPTTRGGR